jgi:hypothetical protein
MYNLYTEEKIEKEKIDKKKEEKKYEKYKNKFESKN